MRLQDGHLILVHHSGKFAEFEDGYMLNMDSLRRSYKKYVNERDKRRPDLSMLFDQSVGNNEPASNPISFVGPHFLKYNGHRFCLNWSSDTSKKFNVLIKDLVTEDPIIQQEVEGFSLDIDLSLYRSPSVSNVVSVEIFDLNNDLITSGKRSIMFGIEGKYAPNFCADESALNSLEIGCHLVWSGNVKALDYFENAAELSDKPFYENIKIGLGGI